VRAQWLGFDWNPTPVQDRFLEIRKMERRWYISQQIRRFDSNRDRQIDARIQSWIDFVKICASSPLSSSRSEAFL
jgi:hypothetical protein